MAYFVTGATGFIGRFLVQELLDNRDGEVYVLCRAGSRARLDRMIRQWRGGDRVVPVAGDLTEERLGVDPAWIDAHAGEIEHFFHLAAIHDMAASEQDNELLNVGGTRHALDLAGALGVGCFHHVSDMAVAGDYRGIFDETMFEEGQRLRSTYYRAKFDAEEVVREECPVPWRVYRPAMVIGHSETGERDKTDGPYYLFPLLKRMRDTLPSWLPLASVDLGDTNVVPVDYVTKAMDHLAHLPDHDGEAFHLVNPEPQRIVDVVNAFAAAAKAPRFAVPVDRSLTSRLPTALLPPALRPGALLGAALGTALGTAPAKVALAQTVARLGAPPEVLERVSVPAVYASRRTQRALAGSGIAVPDLDSCAAGLWSWWENYLDDSIRQDKAATAALTGKTVVITGASSSIGKVTAVQVAKAGATPILVADDKDRLEATKRLIESQGGAAYACSCDLSDLQAIDALSTQLLADFTRIDYAVNNAGRSIRRSLKLSEGGFDDLERTMQSNYFGAVRLVMRLLPRMREEQSGHIVNVSSIGVRTSPPRFSSYVASKAALDAWSNVVSSDMIGDGISFTSVHMPLVRTPMVPGTEPDDRFPSISPAQAAAMVVRALVEKPHEVNPPIGSLGALAQTVAPRAVFRMLGPVLRGWRW